MHSIGASEAKKSEHRNVADGLRLSVTVPKWARDAMRTKPNDKLWVRAEANGNSTEFIGELHSNGRSFTIAKDERQDLSLDEGDEVQVWVSRYSESTTKPTRLTDRQSQKDEEIDDEGETLLRMDPPIDALYHIKDGDQTVCGESIDDDDYVEITDPGDALAPCPRCNLKSPDKMSNVQIVEHLAEKAGFDYSETNPSYFSKDQLVSLLEYIVELEESQNGN